jgi:hypothetical protein
MWFHNKWYSIFPKKVRVLYRLLDADGRPCSDWKFLRWYMNHKKLKAMRTQFQLVFPVTENQIGNYYIDADGHAVINDTRKQFGKRRNKHVR